ncbi:MAG TPA: 5'-deoxynucleotidase [Candidatus Anaerofilum faecale]|nr:5'-deoxynucleotidase [Anaerofilum sp. An201]OUP05425.1 5'-deoxynucleotidase [Anaerofilum sp. An201]HIX12175.1 5'-deoxynucleotidase [Candidatus Anaerofilum faecale]
MKLFPFSALLARMKYIQRWSLMRTARPETLSEHTAETAQLAHLLCLLARARYGAPVRPEAVAVAALYHDAAEILTGDMPTPVKYKSEGMLRAYRAIEAESLHTMRRMLPPDIQPALAPYLDESGLNEEERRLLKAADRLSAIIKCTEECRTGNREFASALEQQMQALADMHCPAADDFVRTMLPCYEQNLDELTRMAL